MQPQTMTRQLSGILVLALAGTVAMSAAINEPVRLDSGLISGIAGSSADMQIFKGIPFAAPPVGDLRWRAPQPVAKWEGVRKADKFSDVCMQNVPGGPDPDQQVSEDCLYLNVWTSAKSADERRPVMLWIYGGGFNVGSAAQPDYDGEALAKKGTVIVTINYRLGALGFLSHPELTKESGHGASGNYGLMDMVAALEWVQRNIEAFGGDPQRVTAFGESAGSIGISYLMASPHAKGLFHRAIGESSAWRPLPNLKQAEEAGVKYAAALGATTLAGMRAASAEAVLKAGRGNPVLDGWFLPTDVGTVFAQGKQMDVPVLVGSNKDEGGSSQPITAAKFIEQSRQRLGDLADQFLKVYPAGSDQEATASQYAAGSDEVAFAMRRWAELSAKPGKSKSYMFFFAHQPPPARAANNNANNDGNNAGRFGPGSRGTAVHTAEIRYVFQTLTDGRAYTDLDRQVADTMSSYWVNFAATGDPNGAGLPKWPALGDGQNQSAMVFGSKAEVGPAPSAALLAVQRAIYDMRSRP